MPAVIFSSTKVKTLKDTLTLNGNADIISSSVDPTSSAVNAPIGSLLINQTTGKQYRKLDSGSSTNWVEVGAGTSGINYITNPDAEANTTGWVTYADAAGTSPVDGTGGSPNVTWTRTTTTPIRGIADFLFTKDAANRQGQGASFPFTIARADLAKVLTVSFEYEVISGTYANGDLTVYIIAPSGAVIQPAGYTIQSVTTGTQMKHVATFQTEATGTGYRLCIHVASTSASAYVLALDTISVGPQVITQGTPASELGSLTTSGSWVTNTTYTSQYWRIADRLRGQIKVALSGAPTSANLTITLPYTLDINKMLFDDSGASIVGTVLIRDSGTNTIKGVAQVLSSSPNQLLIRYEDDAAAGVIINTVTQAAPITFGANDAIIINFEAPVSGWSSQTQMSSDTDTRVVAANAETIAGTSLATATNYFLSFGTPNIDTHGAVINPSAGHVTTSGTGWYYLVPVSGIYEITAYARINSATGFNGSSERMLLSATLDGVNAKTMGRIEPTATEASPVVNGTILIQANAGQKIEIQFNQDSGGSLSLASGSVQIRRLSGPSQIAASETVAARATCSTAATITSSGNVIPFDAITQDTHGAISGLGTSSFRFTAPISGLYSVKAKVLTASSTTSQAFILRLRKNGSLASEISYTVKETTSSTRHIGFGSDEIRLLAGEYIDVQALVGSVSTTLNPSAADNFISIVRVGNY